MQMKTKFVPKVMHQILAVILRQFFLKMDQPVLFFVYFRSFQTNIITILTTNMCEKCPSSIWCRDLNLQPSERESLPITTRPGLPPNFTTVALWQNKFHSMGPRLDAIFLSDYSTLYSAL